jgi:hypothetical protein
MNPRRQELYDKIRSGDVAHLIHCDLVSQIEEADVELCASGFDNFLLASDLSELRQHHSNLRRIGAEDSSKVIHDFVTWVHSLEPKEREDIFDLHGASLQQFWTAYDEASCRENPQEMAAKAQKKQGEQGVGGQPATPPRVGD